LLFTNKNCYLIITGKWNCAEEARKYYKKDKIARLIPEYLWFKKGISWSLISSGNNVGFRILLENSTFDVTGSSIFLKDDQINHYYMTFGYFSFVTRLN
jgi:hypothetical protein